MNTDDKIRTYLEAVVAGDPATVMRLFESFDGAEQAQFSAFSTAMMALCTHELVPDDSSSTAHGLQLNELLRRDLQSPWPGVNHSAVEFHIETLAGYEAEIEGFTDDELLAAQAPVIHALAKRLGIREESVADLLPDLADMIDSWLTTEEE